MGLNAQMLGGKAKRQRGGKRLQSLHLAIKPQLGILTIPVSPADSRAQIFDPKPGKPLHSQIEPVVLKMKPLADPESLGETFGRRFGRAVFTQQAHVVMPVICAAFSFLMSRGSGP